MLKLFLLILFFCALYILWRVVAKHKINSAFNEQRKDLSQAIQTATDMDDLPEKSKMIKQMKDAERLKSNEHFLEKENQTEKIVVESEVAEDIVTDEDQQLFDAAVKLFFENQLKVKDIAQAEQIQQSVLSKMPMQAHSQIGSFDLGEWSIFWHYHEQSLEYYVGRYGVFYAHVDRDGVEHKAEFKDSI